MFDSIQSDLDHQAIITGKYTGNGNKTCSAFSNLGYVPKFVVVGGLSQYGSYSDFGIIIISNNTGLFFGIDRAAGSGDTGSFYADSGGTHTGPFSFSIGQNGFSFTFTGSTSSRPLNANGKTYYYMIFK